MKIFSKYILIVFLCALIVRVSYLLFCVPYITSLLSLNFDGDNYILLARTILDGSYTDIVRGPVYPFFVALFLLSKHSSLFLLRLVQVLLDACTAAGVCFLSKKITDSNKTSLIAGLFYTLYPLALWRIPFVNKAIVFTFLVVFLLVLIIKANENKKLFLFFVCGMLLGIANLTRPILLLLPFIFLLVAFLKKKIKRVIQILIVIGGMFLVMVPWTLRNYYITDEIIPVATERGGLAIFIGNYYPSKGAWEGPEKKLWQEAIDEVQNTYPDKTDAQLDRIYYKKAIENISANPLGFIEMAFYKFFRFWFASASRRMMQVIIPLQALLLLFAGIGLFARWKYFQYKGLLLGFVSYYVSIFVITYSCVRFSLTIMPIVLIFSAAGIEELYKRMITLKKKHYA